MSVRLCNDKSFARVAAGDFYFIFILRACLDKRIYTRIYVYIIYYFKGKVIIIGAIVKT